MSKNLQQKTFHRGQTIYRVEGFKKKKEVLNFRISVTVKETRQGYEFEMHKTKFIVKK